jgi:glutaminyl-tRNA synthetase
MAVLDPLKVVIENADDIPDEIEAVNNPEDENAGTRRVPFSSELFIERNDFMEEPPKKFYRLKPGGTVRLRYAGYIRCNDIRKDADGHITELSCTWFPPDADRETLGCKVRGTIHWVSAPHAFHTEVRLYDRLFNAENPMDTSEGGDWKDTLNPNSLESIEGFLEPCLQELPPGTPVQFERTGYFCVDNKDSSPDRPVFNRTVTLRDTWAKKQQRKQ